MNKLVRYQKGMEMVRSKVTEGLNNPPDSMQEFYEFLETMENKMNSLLNLKSTIGMGEGYIAMYDSGAHVYILGESYDDSLYLAETGFPDAGKFLGMERIIPMKINF